MTQKTPWYSRFGSYFAHNGPILLTFYAVTGTMILAVFKDADVGTLLPTLIGLYLSHKAGTTISGHWAASKDPKADTAQVIRELEGEPHHEDKSPG